jgi:hypothetical protein
MFRRLLPIPTLLLVTGLLAGDAPKPPAGGYSTDFQAAQVDEMPKDLFVLNGTFSVREEAGNKYLELAGHPIDTFGVLFGAESGYATADVRGRVHGTSRGKLFPEFGLGSNDAGGYKVWLLPGQNALELRRGDSPVPKVRVPYKWESGSWTWFRLRVTPTGAGKWKVEAKAWPTTGREPENWALTLEESQILPPGRPSAWGQPYADTPLRFDDLSVSPVTPAKT